MIEQQGPPAEVLGLKDALLLGIEDILTKEVPEALDLFFQGNDQFLHLSSDLTQRLQNTLGTVWAKNPPSESAGNWAVNLFLAHYAVKDLIGKKNGGVRSPFLPFKGYTLVSERREDKSESKLWISAVRNDELDRKPYLEGESKPSLTTPLMEFVRNWAENKEDEELKIFIVETLYVGGKPVKVKPALSTRIVVELTSKLGEDDMGLYEQVLEMGLEHFLDVLTNHKASLRDPRNSHKRADYRTILEDVTLTRQPRKENRDIDEFILVKGKTS